MLKNILHAVSLSTMALSGAVLAEHADGNWVVVGADGWQKAAQDMQGLSVKDGLLMPSEKKGAYRSQMKKFGEKRSLRSLSLEASSKWENWEPTMKKVAPVTLNDAPIFLVKGPNDYWLLGRNRVPRGVKKVKGFRAVSATLDGFDVSLQTTPFPNLYNAPGGLKKSQGGYHAWQSRDMVNWVHHGSVTPSHAKWSTTAEFVDGKAYIYYDFPNDQNPHLFIDEDLSDGVPGKDMGMAFKDPSDGSDCAVIRDLDGKFHLIYEDWSPIDASKHSWDSPLAGHAVSGDGLGEFKILKPAVDERSKATGKFARFPHPHWHQEDTDNYPAEETQFRGKKVMRAFGKYEIHEPEQDAFGDWAAISIGGQYYLAGDYHPANGKIRIGLFTAPSLNDQFKLIGELGDGHPDPDIGFAEGKFYLINQTAQDYVSPGPWVERVEARVGVDTTNDGRVDAWGPWQELRETYDYIPGFSKQVQRIPAAMQLDDLPEGYGFCFELKIDDTTPNSSKPMLKSFELSFAKE